MLARRAPRAPPQALLLRPPPRVRHLHTSDTSAAYRVRPTSREGGRAARPASPNAPARRPVAPARDCAPRPQRSLLTAIPACARASSRVVQRPSLQGRTTAELLRSFIVFKLCTVRPLVQNGAALLKLGRAVSATLTDEIVRRSFFAQFCAGVDAASIQPTIDALKARGIGAILDYAAESDVSEGGPAAAATTATAQQPAAPAPVGPEAALDHNLAVSLAAVTTAKGCGGFAAVKVSSLGEPDLLLLLTRLVAAHRAAWAAVHGCGSWLQLAQERAADASTYSASWRGIAAAAAAAGVSPQDVELLRAWVAAASRRASASAGGGGGGSGACTAPDAAPPPPPHTESVSYVAWCEGLLRCAGEADEATQARVLAAVMRLGGGGGGDGVPGWPPLVLPPSSQQSLGRVWARGEALAARAAHEGVSVLLDAEQTYLQGAIDGLALHLMRTANLLPPAEAAVHGAGAAAGAVHGAGAAAVVVYSTYQAYLRDTRWRLGADSAGVAAAGARFGAKLVRGAYLQTERARARERREADPTQPTITATHASYGACADALLSGVAAGDAAAMFATHNEASVTALAARAAALPPHLRARVSFAQLLGMCDHLTESLAAAGLPVAKYVPYGPVHEVMPYLLRRAQENSDLLGGSDGGGAARELQLLWAELARRARASVAAVQ